MAIDAKGPTPAAQAFHTTMSRYHDNKTGRDFTANDTAPSVTSASPA